MNGNTGRHQTHPLVMALVVLGFLALVPLLVITFLTGDLEWFRNDFSTLPGRVVVYEDGQSHQYIPGTPGYNEVAEAVRASLAAGAIRSSGIGLSPQSQDEARSRYTSVEAFFDQPVKLHAAFNTGSPTQMLFLLTGRHAELPIVFLGVNGEYFSNAPYLNTVDPLKKALLALGYRVTTE